MSGSVLSEIVAKVVIVGPQGVGKTVLTRRICALPSAPGVRSTAPEGLSGNLLDTEPTVGVDFASHTILLAQHDEVRMRLQLYDTAGAENFVALPHLDETAKEDNHEDIDNDLCEASSDASSTHTPFHKTNIYKNASGIIAVADLTDPQSWVELFKRWLPQTLAYSGCAEKLRSAIVICGSKTDCCNDKKESLVSELRKQASFYGYPDALVFATSAKTAEGVQCALDALALRIIKVYAEEIKLNSFPPAVEGGDGTALRTINLERSSSRDTVGIDTPSRSTHTGLHSEDIKSSSSHEFSASEWDGEGFPSSASREGSAVNKASPERPPPRVPPLMLHKQREDEPHSDIIQSPPPPGKKAEEDMVEKKEESKTKAGCKCCVVQ